MRELTSSHKAFSGNENFLKKIHNEELLLPHFTTKFNADSLQSTIIGKPAQKSCIASTLRFNYFAFLPLNGTLHITLTQNFD